MPDPGGGGVIRPWFSSGLSTAAPGPSPAKHQQEKRTKYLLSSGMFSGIKITKKALAGRAVPRTPLGSIQHSLDPLAGLRGTEGRDGIGGEWKGQGRRG